MAAVRIGEAVLQARPWALAFRRLVGGRRLAFTLAICAAVSTQYLFQTQLYDPFSLEGLLRGWLDYLGECLLMGLVIMVALSLVEAAAEQRGRSLPIAAGAAALLVGAVTGASLLVAYYELGLAELGSRRYWSDVVYWLAIGGGVATIHGLNARAAAASAEAHRVRVEQVALAKRMLEARLQVMRAQIEPHFLFNTLANVRRLCRTDLEQGIPMLENFVRYLRAALPRLREERTTLGQEADLADAYLGLLAMRMGSRLAHRVDVAPALREHAFPPMMLLTLVENAIKHGINPSPGGGALAITARLAGGCIEVSVADTGVGFDAAGSGGTGVGLANTRARLRALYGEGAALVLTPNRPSGAVATLRIPLDDARPGPRP